jgi:hypothetical protein
MQKFYVRPQSLRCKLQTTAFKEPLKASTETYDKFCSIFEAAQSSVITVISINLLTDRLIKALKAPRT